MIGEGLIGVEAVRDAIREEHAMGGTPYSDEAYTCLARAAISAHLEALRAAGWVVARQQVSDAAEWNGAVATDMHQRAIDAPAVVEVAREILGWLTINNLRFTAHGRHLARTLAAYDARPIDPNSSEGSRTTEGQ